MGLNPFGTVSPRMQEFRDDVLSDRLNYGSPYFDMFVCGKMGVPLEDCVAKCQRNGIAVRPKDIENYRNGAFHRSMEQGFESVEVQMRAPIPPVEDMRLSDFPKLPYGWTGCERRFFPCTRDNKPMQKWGWSRDFSPSLYTAADARVLSPCGWIGQNMLYQPFVVLDVDGRGHGCDDLSTIEFGRLFSDVTATMEDPAKPGSFHLYFSTDRLIPVKHFPWAKLDFMGNAVNAAVYMKNKKHNGKPMMEMTDEVWNLIIAYQKVRKENVS